MSSLSLLQAEQLSQLVFMGEVVHPSDHFCGPLLHPLQQIHVLPVLRTPELDPGEVSPEWSREEKSPHCELSHLGV